MATRNEPTAATLAAEESLRLLEADFEDRRHEPREFTVETRSGPWTVYSGPVSLRELQEVQALMSVPEGEDVPLENMVDVLMILARTSSGDPMFRKIHRDRLLTKVSPVYLLQAAEFLAEVATEDLATAEEDAGKV